MGGATASMTAWGWWVAERFTARLYEPVQAHEAMRQAWEQYVKPLLSRDWVRKATHG